MGLIALAALTGIGSAFAFSPKAQKGSITYYAVKTPAGYHWQTNKPDPNTYRCLPASTGICTLVTNNVPTDNEIPSGHTADNMLYQLF